MPCWYVRNEGGESPVLSWQAYTALFFAIQFLKLISLVSNTASYFSQHCTVKVGGWIRFFSKKGFELQQPPPRKDSSSFSRWRRTFLLSTWLCPRSSPSPPTPAPHPSRHVMFRGARPADSALHESSKQSGGIKAKELFSSSSYKRKINWEKFKEENAHEEDWKVKRKGRTGTINFQDPLQNPGSTSDWSLASPVPAHDVCLP